MNWFTRAFKTLVLPLLLVFLLAVAAPAADKPQPPESFAVVIVGAGIAGLSAGYFLQEKNFIILERQGRVGGRAVGGKHQGVSYAQGAEYIGPPAGALKEITDGLGLKAIPIPQPMNAALIGDEIILGPDTLRLPLIEDSGPDMFDSLVEQVQMLYEDYDEPPLTQLKGEIGRLDTITAADWFRELKLTKAYFQRLEVFARGWFGAGLEEISALCLLPELAFELQDGAPEPGEDSGTFTFRGGLAGLTRAVGRHLGGRVRTNAKVVAVRQRGRGFLVVWRDAGGRTRNIVTKAVVLAVPAGIALRLAGPVLSPERQELLRQISYASYLTAALFCKQPIFREAFDLAMGPKSYLSNLYDATWVQRGGGPAKKGPYIHLAYVPPAGLKDKDVLTMTGDQVMTRVKANLDAALPGSSQLIEGHKIKRFPYAFPVMTLGAYKRILKLHDLNQGGVFLAGDYMVYPTFEAAAESGRLAAERVLETLD